VTERGLGTFVPRHIKKLITYFVILLAIALPTMPVMAYAQVECECIRYLREVRGLNVRGDAYTLVPNRNLANAEIRDVLLFDIGREDHGAEILGFEGEQLLNGIVVPRFIRIIESNFKRCKVTVRTVEWTDPSIKGVLSPQSTY